MKKLVVIFILSANICLAQFANFTVVNATFNDSIPIPLGSQQSVDVTYTITPGHLPPDSVRIYLFNSANTQIYYKAIAMIWSYYAVGPTHTDSSGFYCLPVNPDGSRTITFNCPTSFPLGQFYLSVNLTSPNFYGIFGNPLGIKQNTSTRQLTSTQYFNLLGQPINKPDGIKCYLHKY